jgi:hypothetical protein
MVYDILYHHGLIGFFYREEEVPEGEDPHGHVTSISVLRSYRRLGLAKKLMVQSRELSVPLCRWCLFFCRPVPNILSIREKSPSNIL